MAQVEAEEFAGDSAYGDELSTYSASLTSSAYNFPSEHGRTYHAYRSGRYPLPNDEKENDRLHIHYALVRKLLDHKLYHAPVAPEDLKRVVDLATGTGAWAIDFADEHDWAEVLANDLSPTLTTLVPPKLKFLVDDIEEDWQYEDQPFDLVHASFLVASIRDWPRLMQQTFNCTKPGGWAEFHDWDTMVYSQDGTLADDAPLRTFVSTIVENREAQGYDSRPGRSLEKRVKDAGFVDVHATKIVVPFGPWPKDRQLKQLGMLNYMQMDQGLDGIGLLLLANEKKPMTFEEMQLHLVEVRKDLKNMSVHSMCDFYIVYGRKPGADDTKIS